MFIIERLISLSCFAGCLLATMCFLSKTKVNSCKWVFLAYLIMLVLFAYFFKPNMLDLTHLHERCLRGYCFYSWDRLKQVLEESAVPMWYLFSWSIYKLTHDVNWIQTIACMWCFGNVFYVINNIIRRNRIPGIQRSLLLFFVMAIGSFYMQTICDIRNMLSFSICFWCIYREMVEDKSIIFHIPLYIFAGLLHQAGMIVLLGRVISLLPLQQGIIYKVVLGMIIFPILAYIILKQNLFLNSAFELAYGYSADQQEYRSWGEFVISLLELGQIFYVLIYYRIYMNRKLQNVWIFSLVLAIICLIFSLISYAIFRRYTILASLLMLPLIGQVFSYDNQKMNHNFTRILLFQSLVIFGLSYTIGDMRFYQFLM